MRCIQLIGEDVRMDVVFLIALERKDVSKCRLKICSLSLEPFSCRLQVKRFGSLHVCFVVSGCRLFVLSGFGELIIHTLHSTIEALSSPVVL